MAEQPFLGRRGFLLGGASILGPHGRNCDKTGQQKADRQGRGGMPQADALSHSFPFKVGAVRLTASAIYRALAVL